MRYPPKTDTKLADSGARATVKAEADKSTYRPSDDAGIAQGANAGYLEALKRSMSKLGIEPEVFDGIPVVVNLDAEIKLCRAQQLRYLTLLSKGVEWLYSDPLTQEMRELDDGEARALKGTRSVLSVEQLLNQSLALTKSMLAAKADIAPGEKSGASIDLRIEVTGSVAQARELPDLDSEADEDENTAGLQADVADDIEAPARDLGYDSAD